MKNRLLLFALPLSAIVLATGCAKDPIKNMSEADSRIYITHRDSTANFAAYHSFSIADSVAVIDNGHLAGMALTDVDTAFIAAVRNMMEQRGYTLVGRNDNPDLGINVSRIYNTYSGLVSYPDYWGSYYGYWDPYYWGYPGYSYYFPTYYGVYQITEGALSIDLLDLKNASSNGNTIEGIWNGLIRGSGIFRVENAPSQVKALFDQSAYIQTSQ